MGCLLCTKKTTPTGVRASSEVEFVPSKEPLRSQIHWILECDCANTTPIGCKKDACCRPQRSQNEFNSICKSFNLDSFVHVLREGNGVEDDRLAEEEYEFISLAAGDFLSVVDVKL